MQKAGWLERHPVPHLRPGQAQMLELPQRLSSPTAVSAPPLPRQLLSCPLPPAISTFTTIPGLYQLARQDMEATAMNTHNRLKGSCLQNAGMAWDGAGCLHRLFRNDEVYPWPTRCYTIQVARSHRSMRSMHVPPAPAPELHPTHKLI